MHAAHSEFLGGRKKMAELEMLVGYLEKLSEYDLKRRRATLYAIHIIRSYLTTS